MRKLWLCYSGGHIWEDKYSPGWIPEKYLKCKRCGKIKKLTPQNK